MRVALALRLDHRSLLRESLLLASQLEHRVALRLLLLARRTDELVVRTLQLELTGALCGGRLLLVERTLGLEAFGGRVQLALPRLSLRELCDGEGVGVGVVGGWVEGVVWRGGSGGREEWEEGRGREGGGC